MTTENEGKNKKNLQPNTEVSVPETSTPPTIDVGEAADPFERLQTKKVAVAQ